MKPSATIYMQQLIHTVGQRFGLGPFDWGWLILSSLTAMVIFVLSLSHMQVFDMFLFVTAAFLLGWSGLRWRALRYCYLSVALLMLLTVLFYLYGFERAEATFVLPYMLSSPAAIVWLCLLACLSLITFVLTPHLKFLSAFPVSDGLAWAALSIGLSGFFARWYESYLVGVEAALMPLASLYDVLLLMVLCFLLLYLLLKRFHQDVAWPGVILFTACVMAGLLFMLRSRYQLYMIESRAVELAHFWLRIHVLAMVLSYVLLLAGGVLAAVQLLQTYHGLQGAGQNIATLLLNRLFSLGVLCLALGLASGMLWSELAWGRLWLWETKQITTLAVCCYYAAGMHVVLRRQGQHSITAWWLVFGILLLVFALFWSNTLPAGHHYFGQLAG